MVAVVEDCRPRAAAVVEAVDRERCAVPGGCGRG